MYKEEEVVAGQIAELWDWLILARLGLFLGFDEKFLSSFKKLYTNHAKSITAISTIMSNTQDIQKTLEVKIRPYSSPNNQERPDQKGVSRVHMCKEALMDLGLHSGQACYLWKKDESLDTRKEAVAWLTAEKNLSKKVVQISKTFQEVCGYKLADDLVIGPAGSVNIADSIILRDVTEGLEPVTELGSDDKPHWEWYLRENLGGSIFRRLFYRAGQAVLQTLQPQ